MLWQGLSVDGVGERTIAGDIPDSQTCPFPAGLVERPVKMLAAVLAGDGQVDDLAMRFFAIAPDDFL